VCIREIRGWFFFDLRFLRKSAATLVWLIAICQLLGSALFQFNQHKPGHFF
jgi:hypothetical protein